MHTCWRWSKRIISKRFFLRVIPQFRVWTHVRHFDRLRMSSRGGGEGEGSSFPAPKALLDDISGPIFNPHRFDLTTLQCLEKYFFFLSFLCTIPFSPFLLFPRHFFGVRFFLRHSLHLLSLLFLFFSSTHVFVLLPYAWLPYDRKIENK